MRIFDKKIKMKKANILAEKRYLESKGIIIEDLSHREVSDAEFKNKKILIQKLITKLNDELERFPIMSKWSHSDEGTKLSIENITLIDKRYDPKIGFGPTIEFDNDMGWFTIEPKGVNWRVSSSVKVSEDNWKTFMGLGHRVIDESSGLNDVEKNLLKDRLRHFIDNALRQEKRNNVREDKTITEETFSDLFDFFNTDPKNMSQGSVYYVGDMNSSMNKNIIDDNGNKVPNPLYGKLFKHTRFMFKWEDTFSKAMDRIDPDYVMGQRSGNFEKIDGYKVLEKGPNGLYFPIIPTGSEYKLFVDNNGNMEEIEKEKVQKFLRPASPSASKITSGDKATFRLLMLDKIVKITGGGNVWINPNFKGEYKGLGTVTEEPAIPKDQYDFIKSSIESASGDEVGEKEVDENGRAVYPSLNHRHVYYFTGDEFNGDIIKNDTETGERYPIGNMEHYGVSRAKDDINNTMY